jgi:hypothetical protein
MKTYPIVILTFLLYLNSVIAQGCSDAGICSIGNTYTFSDIKKNQLEFSSVFGAGEADITYISPYISYTRDFNERWAASLKVTSSFASGSFGKRGSVGDAFAILHYKPLAARVYNWSYTAGAKLPFNRANLKINNHPLPLDYQSSLGTFDLIGGVGLNYKSWDFNVAVQIPVFNINANSYISDYAGTDDFPTTNLFERKPDALLRGTYTIKTNEKFTFKPNLLLIYHLGEDTYEDIYGKRMVIYGSEGLTVNGNLITAYNFKSGNLELSMATPFVVRETRPDGLTRAYTVAIGYKTEF